MDRVLADQRIIGGGTGIRFERSSFALRCTYGLRVVLGSLIRLSLGQRPSSHVDAGVVFCRGRDFEAIGGYNERHYFTAPFRLPWDVLRRS